MKEQLDLESILTERQKRQLVKLVRKEFFENNSIAHVRQTMAKLRSHFSKEFWSVIKTAIKYGKKATIAIAFKQNVNQRTGLAEEQVTFKEYIGKLFGKPVGWTEMEAIETSNRIQITQREMDWAFDTLKINKAVGIDGLPDFILKDKKRRKLL